MANLGPGCGWIGAHSVCHAASLVNSLLDTSGYIR